MSGAAEHPLAVRRAARVAIAWTCAILAAGCGGDAQHAPAHGAAPADDTVRVNVAGRRILIPAPDGMADVITASHARPTRGRHGDLHAGVFVPRERLQAILDGARPTDLSVTASIPAVNTAQEGSNVRRFESMRSRQLERGRHPESAVESGLKAAFDRWQQGDRQAVAAPFGGPEGDTVIVAVRSHDDRAVQLITVGWDPAAATYDHHASEIVLAGGRIVHLTWSRRGGFGVQTLAEISAALDGWTDAVIAANR